MAIYTVTGKGQITLRKTLLQHLGAGPGTQLSAEPLAGGRVELKVVQPASSLDELFGSLKGKTRRRLSVGQIDETAKAGWARR